MALDCFKACDIRGRVPDQLNEDIARRIGRAYAITLKPARVVVGHDIRLSSEALKAALAEGAERVVRETVERLQPAFAAKQGGKT